MALPQRTTWKVIRVLRQTGWDYCGAVENYVEERIQVNEPQSDVVASLTHNGLHAPILDLDYTCSANMAASCVYFGRIISRRKCVRLLRELWDAGLPVYAEDSGGNTVLSFRTPIRLVESSTHGHFHLFIDYEIDWAGYKKVLHAFRRAGLIDKNYYRLSIKSGMSMVRQPWNKKSDQPDKAYCYMPHQEGNYMGGWNY